MFKLYLGLWAAHKDKRNGTERVHALGRRVARPVDRIIAGPARGEGEGGQGVLSYPKSKNILGEGRGGATFFYVYLMSLGAMMGRVVSFGSKWKRYFALLINPHPCGRARLRSGAELSGH